MGFFRRLFSPEYRHALAAEAEGDYLTAARSYALCGERGKVTDMHLAQARNEQSIEGRIRSLRNALAFAPQEDADHRRPMVLRLLARALQERGESLGVETQEGRRDLTEAATLLEQGEAWAGAGEAYLALGQPQAAAQAYSRGGMIEKVEQVLAAQEQETSRIRKIDSGFSRYELLLQEGRRDEALAALGDCIDAAEQKGEYRRLREELQGKLITSGSVELGLGERRLRLIGQLPLTVGRELDNQLIARGPSVSRRHARIDWEAGEAGEANGRFTIEDLDSHNGTQLNGLTLGGAVPLPATGATINLGDSCEIEADGVEGEAALLRLRVSKGIDRDRQALVCHGPLPLSRVDGHDRIPVTIAFTDGRPWLALAGGGPPTLRLNGALVPGPVQLIQGDRLLVGEAEILVKGQ